MLPRLTTCLLLALVACAASAALAADAKPNPVGTWKWSTPAEMALKLKLEGDQLTGVFVRDGKEMPLTEVKFADGKLTCQAVRDSGGNKATWKFQGTITGDTIKGKIDIVGPDGTARPRDWEAKRAKDAKE